jgi:hypothetical protein
LYRPPSGGAIDHELIWGALALAMLAAAWLWPSVVGEREVFFCPFKAMTGLPCCLCGGTHAMEAFAHGQWAAAWRLNPLAVGIGLVALAVVAYAALAVTTGRRWRPRPEHARPLAIVATATAALVAAANWAWLIHQALNK